MIPLYNISLEAKFDAKQLLQEDHVLKFYWKELWAFLTLLIPIFSKK